MGTNTWNNNTSLWKPDRRTNLWRVSEEMKRADKIHERRVAIDEDFTIYWGIS